MPPIANKLSLATLHEVVDVEGTRNFEAAVNAGLQRIVEDCDTRPDEKKPRVLTVQIKFVPKSSTGTLTGFDMDAAVDVKVPKLAPAQMKLGVTCDQNKTVATIPAPQPDMFPDDLPKRV